MSSAVAEREQASVPGESGDRTSDDRNDNGDRGGLDIHQSVIRKVATRVVEQVAGTLPGASVKVRGEGQYVEIAVKVGLDYPNPVRATAAEVRRTVTDEVERITGYRVADVAVTVSALRPEPRPRVE
ncbi:putative alkaline shock family protein YloU [Saccharothrix tamanrassetensis]|uniref:Putative alkaline shock family protein YloU n=1 Tax=Saccharothrix tamanrassetensis TaxID=1051531 RepID=A0A841CN52_9PSEU|nr:Asp23/Gls24 family envelope stress response protein [Saccharothrix tamanrassetensis]MBB5958353.1 putative alkaline shock family protein YloU [Saccharothrix tamanrassetensis]